MIDPNASEIENLNELFAYPVGLYLVTKIDNMPLYSSDRLKRAFIKSIYKSSKLKKVGLKIENLVNGGVIVPAFMNKGIFKLSVFKLFSKDSYIKSAVAFYHSGVKKIYILIDNNINIFGYASNEWISELLTHELMHMSAGHNPMQFFNIFKKAFNMYYGQVLKLIFQLSEIPDAVDFARFLFMDFEKKSSVSTNNLNKLYNKLSYYKNQSSLSEKIFNKYCFDYIYNITLRYKNFNAWYNEHKKWTHILGPLKQAYQVFGNNYKDMSTMVCQELNLPSEVIAMLSEKNSSFNNNVYKAIHIIK